MNFSSRYVINAPDVVSEDFNGEMVILNLANGHYFSLHGIASKIWTSLGEGHGPDAILASIAAGQPKLVESSSAFFERLAELALIVPREDDAAKPTTSLDQTWSADAPDIEVFEDLAELIAADPIHDVDEQAGWPTPRATP
jgi:hypothetical protein